MNPIESLFVAKSRKGRLSKSYYHCTCVKSSVNTGILTHRADCSWKESYTPCQAKAWAPKRCEFRHRRDAGLDDDDEEIDVDIDKVIYKPPSPEVNVN